MNNVVFSFFFVSINVLIIVDFDKYMMECFIVENGDVIFVWKMMMGDLFF